VDLNGSDVRLGVKSNYDDRNDIINQQPELNNPDISTARQIICQVKWKGFSHNSSADLFQLSTL